MSNIIKYQPLDSNELDAAFKEFESGGSFLKPKVGLTVVRVLPPPQGAAWKAMVLGRKHYYKPSGAEKAQSFFCPRNIKQPCPLCARADELKETGNDLDFEEARRLWPGVRVVMNVIDRESPGEGPKVWEAPRGVGDRLREILRGVDASDGEFSDGLSGDFTSVTEGFDLGIRKKGAGLTTEWTVIPAKRRTPLSADAAQAADWIASQRDLNKIIRPSTTEEVMDIMNGGATRAAKAPTGPNAQDILEGEFEDSF